MARFNQWAQYIAVTGVIVCLLILAALALTAEAKNGQSPSEIAANVNGEVITTEQLEKALQDQIEQMNNQLERFRQSMLDKLINNLLLQQAARAEGLDANAYLKVKVENITVSEDEVDEAYVKSKHRFPATLESEVKYRIRRKLEDNRRAEALKQLLAKLRRAATVRNFLLDLERHRNAFGASKASVCADKQGR